MKVHRITDWIILAVALAFCGYVSIIALAFGFEAPSVPDLVQRWLGPVWLTLFALNAVLAVVTLLRKGVNHAVLVAIAPIPASVAVLVVAGILSRLVE